MLHDLIALTVLTAIAAAVWWMTSPDRRTRAAAKAAWEDGADLATGWMLAAEPAPVLAEWHDVPPRDSSPPCKAGRPRCRECRLGGDCRQYATGELPVYAAGHPLPRDGRHSGPAAVARWLAGGWELSELPIGLRRQLGRLAGAVRVPAQLGIAAGRLP